MILSTFLTMIMYWILFGVSVAAFLLVVYGIAEFLGSLVDDN